MLAMEQGASSTRPWLPRVSPMATSSPSRQHRQLRLLPALRASSAHCCGRERRGSRGCPLPSAGMSPPQDGPQTGMWGLCRLPGRGCSPLGAGRGAGGAYEGSRAEETGQQQGRDSTGDGLRGSAARSARSSPWVPFPCCHCPWKLIQGTALISDSKKPRSVEFPGFVLVCLERGRGGRAASILHPSLIPTLPRSPPCPHRGTSSAAMTEALLVTP